MIVQAAGDVGLNPLTSNPDAPLSEPWNAMIEAGLTVRHVFLLEVNLPGTRGTLSCKDALIAAIKFLDFPSEINGFSS